MRRPRCAIFSSVPPQVCSASSRWAAMAKISSGAVDMSVDSLLENDAQMISGKGVAGCALPTGARKAPRTFFLPKILKVHRAIGYDSAA